MSVPAQFPVGPDEHPLIVEPGEPYSVFWTSDRSLSAFLDCVDAYASVDADTVLYTDENPTNELYSYEEVKDRIASESPQFFRLNTEDLDITWERKPNGMVLIGIIANEFLPSDIEYLYQETTDLDLPSEGLTEIAELI